MVERLHRQGQKVTLWVALFMAGKATRAYQQVRTMLARDASGKERIDLCPCHPDTPGYLARTFLKLATDYDLDGFWLDFMDGLHVPCHASHRISPPPREKVTIAAWAPSATRSCIGNRAFSWKRA